MAWLDRLMALKISAELLHNRQISVAGSVYFIQQFCRLFHTMGRHPVLHALEAFPASRDTALDIAQSQVRPRLVEVELPVQPEVGFILNVLANLLVQSQRFLWLTHMQIAPAFQ